MSSAIIDTHAHLDFDRFDSDRQNTIYRAREANVKGIINVGIDLTTTLKSIELAEKYTNIFATAGIHPHDAIEATDEDIEALRELLYHPKVVAIGEVGLDFYRNISPPDVQRKLFRMFMDWFFEYDLPLVIHTRDADEAMLSILKEKSKSGWRGVFHCFAGDQQMAAQVLEMGFHISFTGNITFKNSSSVHVMRDVPMDRLLVETDSPFLTPMPHRGKRNEPAYVNFVVEKIANVKGLTPDEVAHITTKNAQELFDIQLIEEV